MKRRYNAASVAHGAMGDMTAGFSGRRLKRGAVIVAGAFGTSWLAGKIVEKAGITNKLLSTGITFLTAGLAATGAKFARLSGETSNEILAGGIVAGMTEGLSGIFPAYIKPIGMSDWSSEMGHGWSNVLSGMGDEATTKQVRRAFSLNDSADQRQVSHHMVAGYATPDLGHENSTALGAWHPGQLYKGTGGVRGMKDYGGPGSPHFTMQGVRPGFNGAADAAVSEHIASM
jgi:hypothetical protein